MKEMRAVIAVIAAALPGIAFGGAFPAMLVVKTFRDVQFVGKPDGGSF
jgi:hypothetical protein